MVDDEKNREARSQLLRLMRLVKEQADLREEDVARRGITMPRDESDDEGTGRTRDFTPPPSPQRGARPIAPREMPCGGNDSGKGDRGDSLERAGDDSAVPTGGPEGAEERPLKHYPFRKAGRGGSRNDDEGKKRSEGTAAVGDPGDGNVNDDDKDNTVAKPEPRPWNSAAPDDYGVLQEKDMVETTESARNGHGDDDDDDDHNDAIREDDLHNGGALASNHHTSGSSTAAMDELRNRLSVRIKSPSLAFGRSVRAVKSGVAGAKANAASLLDAGGARRGASPSPAKRHAERPSDEGAEGPLPVGWRWAADPASGRAYYYHRASRETSWVRPRAHPSDGGAPGDGKATPQKGREKASSSPSPTAPSSLLIRSKGDHDCGEDRRKRGPAKIRVLPPTMPFSFLGKSKDGDGDSNERRPQLPLPEGWRPAKDPKTGKLYYYHRASNRVSWDRPAATKVGASRAASGESGSESNASGSAAAKKKCGRCSVPPFSSRLFDKAKDEVKTACGHGGGPPEGSLSTKPPSCLRNSGIAAGCPSPSADLASQYAMRDTERRVRFNDESEGSEPRYPCLPDDEEEGVVARMEPQTRHPSRQQQREGSDSSGTGIESSKINSRIRAASPMRNFSMNGHFSSSVPSGTGKRLSKLNSQTRAASPLKNLSSRDHVTSSASGGTSKRLLKLNSQLRAASPMRNLTGRDKLASGTPPAAGPLLSEDKRKSENEPREPAVGTDAKTRQRAQQQQQERGSGTVKRLSDLNSQTRVASPMKIFSTNGYFANSTRGGTSKTLSKLNSRMRAALPMRNLSTRDHLTINAPPAVEPLLLDEVGDERKSENMPHTPSKDRLSNQFNAGRASRAYEEPLPNIAGRSIIDRHGSADDEVFGRDLMVYDDGIIDTSFSIEEQLNTSNVEMELIEAVLSNDNGRQNDNPTARQLKIINNSRWGVQTSEEAVCLAVSDKAYDEASEVRYQPAKRDANVHDSDKTGRLQQFSLPWPSAFQQTLKKRADASSSIHVTKRSTSNDFLESSPSDRTLKNRVALLLPSRKRLEKQRSSPWLDDAPQEGSNHSEKQVKSAAMSNDASSTGVDELNELVFNFELKRVIKTEAEEIADEDDLLAPSGSRRWDNAKKSRGVQARAKIEQAIDTAHVAGCNPAEAPESVAEGDAAASNDEGWEVIVADEKGRDLNLLQQFDKTTSRRQWDIFHAGPVKFVKDEGGNGSSNNSKLEEAWQRRGIAKEISEEEAYRSFNSKAIAALSSGGVDPLADRGATSSVDLLPRLPAKEEDKPPTNDEEEAFEVKEEPMPYLKAQATKRRENRHRATKKPASRMITKDSPSTGRSDKLTDVAQDQKAVDSSHMREELPPSNERFTDSLCTPTISSKKLQQGHKTTVLRSSPTSSHCSHASSESPTGVDQLTKFQNRQASAPFRPPSLPSLSSLKHHPEQHYGETSSICHSLHSNICGEDNGYVSSGEAKRTIALNAEDITKDNSNEWTVELELIEEECDHHHKPNILEEIMSRSVPQTLDLDNVIATSEREISIEQDEAPQLWSGGLLDLEDHDASVSACTWRSGGSWKSRVTSTLGDPSVDDNTRAKSKHSSCTAKSAGTTRSRTSSVGKKIGHDEVDEEEMSFLPLDMDGKFSLNRYENDRGRPSGQHPHSAKEIMKNNLRSTSWRDNGGCPPRPPSPEQFDAYEVMYQPKSRVNSRAKQRCNSFNVDRLEAMVSDDAQRLASDLCSAASSNNMQPLPPLPPPPPLMDAFLDDDDDSNVDHDDSLNLSSTGNHKQDLWLDNPPMLLDPHDQSDIDSMFGTYSHDEEKMLERTMLTTDILNEGNNIPDDFDQHDVVADNIGADNDNASAFTVDSRNDIHYLSGVDFPLDEVKKKFMSISSPKDVEIECLNKNAHDCNNRNSCENAFEDFGIERQLVPDRLTEEEKAALLAGLQKLAKKSLLISGGSRPFPLSNPVDVDELSARSASILSSITKSSLKTTRSKGSDCETKMIDLIKVDNLKWLIDCMGTEWDCAGEHDDNFTCWGGGANLDDTDAAFRTLQTWDTDIDKIRMNASAFDKLIDYIDFAINGCDLFEDGDYDDEDDRTANLVLDGNGDDIETVATQKGPKKDDIETVATQRGPEAGGKVKNECNSQKNPSRRGLRWPGRRQRRKKQQMPHREAVANTDAIRMQRVVFVAPNSDPNSTVGFLA